MGYRVWRLGCWVLGSDFDSKIPDFGANLDYLSKIKSIKNTSPDTRHPTSYTLSPNLNLAERARGFLATSPAWGCIGFLVNTCKIGQSLNRCLTQRSSKL